MPDLSSYPQEVRDALLEAVRRDPGSIANSPFHDSFIERINGPYTRTETISFARPAAGPRQGEREPETVTLTAKSVTVAIDSDLERLPAKERRRIEKQVQAWIKKRWG